MVRPTRVQPALAVVVAVVMFIAVTRAGVAATGSAEWTATDLRWVLAVNAVADPALGALAVAINVIFGPLGAALITVAVVAGTALSTRSARSALRIGLLIALPWGTADLVKALVRRPRPDSSLLQYVTGIEPTTYSYPSGHTAFAVALVVAVVLTFAGRARAIASVAGTVVVIATAWSRVYLGVHYPTDVLASIVLVPSATWAVYEITRAVSGFAARRHPSVGENPGRA